MHVYTRYTTLICFCLSGLSVRNLELTVGLGLHPVAHASRDRAHGLRGARCEEGPAGGGTDAWY